MTERSGGKPAHGEPVVDRALRLLSAFEGRADGLTLTSLSARAGLSKSTTLRLARRLMVWGALERTEDGTFVIGLRLLEIASMAPRGHGLRAVALPFMEDLHHATGQHVLLAVRDETEAVAVERLSAHDAGRVLYRVGGRMPLPATGVGLVLLAHAPVAVRNEVLADDLVLDDTGERVTPDQTRRALAEVLRTGVATMERTRPEPMRSVAAPIHSGGSVEAAVSVIAPAGSASTTALTPAVITVARAISRELSRAGRRGQPQ
ncbi:IclR family transcriptional regulator [Amycolatopsis rhabdoformis]|uniref:IclR family transcriptional regulator n=1 Tax=Amycolatopsis rhabdoformis TaxID=1448059 RepID=A0ABZ1IJT0_9PSEU|nr:IclR family transcriptional regulator [Amycolatopsis rhabdoformis]WSE34739.1 IclR family transcriptional regulator [Amycolatopsis rhabdoformis]